MIAGIDLGTSSVKIVCTDGEKSTASSKSSYRENTVEGWMRALSAASKKLPEKIKREITAIGLSSQVGTYVVNDSEVLSWQQGYGKKELSELRDAFTQNDFIREISMDHPDIISYPLPRIRYLLSEEKNIKTVCQPKEIVCRLLTGNIVSDRYSWRGLANQATGRYSDRMLKWLGLLEGALPEIIAPEAVAGYVTKEAAEATGFTEGIPVYTGCNDYYASLIGMGITGPGQMFDVTGTSEHIGGVTETLELRNRCVSSPYIEGNVLYGVTASSGDSLSYGIKMFDMLSLKVEHYLRNERKAAGAPIFLPYLKGERAPIYDSNARGVFFGISSDTSREDMAYSVMEGVTFSIWHIRNQLDMPFTPDIMSVSGGAAENPEQNQLKADVFGIPVRAAYESDTSAYGAAIIASVGEGIHDSIDTAAKKMVRYHETVNPVEHPILKKRFEIYGELYPDLRRQFERFRNL